MSVSAIQCVLFKGVLLKGVLLKGDDLLMYKNKIKSGSKRKISVYCYFDTFESSSLVLLNRITTMKYQQSKQRLSEFLESFHLLSTDELTLFLGAFNYQQTKRNQPISSCIDSNPRMYFVADGLLRQFSTMPSKIQLDTIIDRGFVLPSTFFLSTASFQQKKVTLIYSETIKRTTLLYIDRCVLDQLFVQIPALSLLFCQLMEHYFFDMERLNLILHMSNCQMRYEYYCLYFAAHIQQVPDKYIAQFLNISHSELSRIRGRIAKGKLFMAKGSSLFVD